MSRTLVAVLLPAVLALALLAGTAAAQDVFQEGTTITVELMNGDKLTGILEDADGPMLVIRHDVFGRMEIPRAAIKPPAPPAPAVEPVSPWSGKFDLALSGSEGNTDEQDFRVGFDAKHDYPEAIDVYTAWFTRSSTNNEATEEKSFALARHEWKLEDSKWRPFVQGSYERDLFLDYDSRIAAAVGGAYPCLDGEKHDVTSRLGAGISEKSGVDDPDVKDTSYEALVGMDWLWAISATASFTFVSDVYPSISEAGEFRSVSKAAYEVKVDPDSAWFLKLGVDHIYDSDAGDARAADYNYYAGLGRTF